MVKENLYNAISTLMAIDVLLNQKKQAIIDENNKLSAGFIEGLPDISQKADKATTLSGYNINDAYTKTQVDDKISAFSQELIDPGEYTAFEVTAIDTKKIQKIGLIIDGATISATSGDIGNLYNISIDWGDGYITSGKPTMVSSFTDDNQCIWKNEAVKYFGKTLAADRFDVNYQHTYINNGTYKIKILGTTYYHFRCNTEAKNIISRCMQYDLPLYRGLTRLQGAFAKSVALKYINCPSYYAWPTNLVDAYGMFENCINLQSVGNMVLPNNVLGIMSFFSYTNIKQGIYVPDSVINAQSMYSNCTQLIYAPNTGKNNRCIKQMFYGCKNLISVGGQISQYTKQGHYAFFSTSNLINTPNFNSNIVWANKDGNDDWKDGFSSNYTDQTCISYMFTGSGIRTAPELGSICSGIIVNCNALFRFCKNMTTLPRIPEGAGNCSQIFNGCTFAQTCHKTNNIIDVIPSTATNLDQAFYNCIELREAPTIPTSVTTINQCFAFCKSLQKITPFKQDAEYTITNASKLFFNCQNLKSVYNTFPSSITNLSECFYYCYLLSDLDWRTIGRLTNATNMSNMFQGCKSLRRVYGVIPDSVTNTSNMFIGCSQLRMAPGFNASTSNCTDMSKMYYGCWNLTSISNNAIIPKNITNISLAFYECNSLIANIKNIIPYSFTTFNQINIQQLFQSCSNLYGTQTQINQLGNKLWNSDKIFTNIEKVFSGCSIALRKYIPTSWGGLKEV